MAKLKLVPDIHRATHRIGVYLQDALAPRTNHPRTYHPRTYQRSDRPKKADVSQAEAHVLAHLHEQRDAASGVAALQASFGHKPSTLTSVLDRLVARELVTREISPSDRRSFIVRLTRRGKTTAARVHAALITLEARVLRGRRGQLSSLHAVL